ncbi:hypothetical protein [Nonlabens agnitus]|uniref:Uncharacterized protein n=1 Tax=Nonlabens agnitus TaxID=870484 RepID=A0A2S9WXD5_9FLAO|nr:hypothetical protein [Nonlabens agnitus]PRP68111.1 hypothetical protein BST86_13950 [Nonlabens agnitus]
MDKIEFILKKDADGNNVNLNRMSIADTLAVREILDALLSIAQHEAGLNLQIGLKKSSAAIALYDRPTLENSTIQKEPGLEVVFKKIQTAAESKEDRDNFYIGKLNKVLHNVEKFQEFEVNYTVDEKTESIKPLFSKKFRKTRKRVKLPNNYNIKFISGVLQENGGSKPNFHLVLPDDRSFTIQCTKEEAQKINTLLYRKVHISAWAKQLKYNIEYQYCDIYVGSSEDLFQEFDSFFKKLKQLEGTQPYHAISEKLMDYYDNKEYIKAKKFIRCFINDFALPSYLRIILTISKGLREEEDLTGVLAQIEKILENQVGKVY